MIIASIRRGYGNLARFSGRDTRAQFWPFVLIHLGAVMAGMMILFAVMIPPILRGMRDAAAARANGVAIAADGAGTSPIGTSPLSAMLPFVLAMGAVFIVLIAAACVRRLHDTGRPGWIAAIPALLFAASGLMMGRVFTQPMETGEIDTGYFMATWLVTMIYNISVLALAALLCMKSEAGTNRFDQPE